MFEIVLLAVIVVSLYRRRGERWEWNRARVGRAFSELSREGERALGRARQSGPGLVQQCVADVRSLGEDLLAVLHPSARRRITDATRRVFAHRQRLRGSGANVDLGPSPIAAVGGVAGADPAYARLQRRYLDGGISLNQYVEEADRLLGQ